jgi:hypothetical protein
MQYNAPNVPNGYYTYHLPHWENKELARVFEVDGERFVDFINMDSPRRLNSFPANGIFESSEPTDNLNLSPEEIKGRVQELTKHIKELTKHIKELLGGLRNLTGIRCTCDEKTLCVSVPDKLNVSLPTKTLGRRFYFLLDVKLESIEYTNDDIGRVE